MIYYRFSYIFVPLVVYGLFIAIYQLLKFPLHFFYTTHTSLYETIIVGSVNLFAALSLYFLLTFNLDSGRRNMSSLGSIFMILYLAGYIILLLTGQTPPVISKIIFLTIIIIFSKYNMNSMVFSAVLILFTVKIMYVGGRAELIMFSMIYFRNFLMNTSFRNLVVFALAAVVFLMIGLQALESQNYVSVAPYVTLYSQIVPIWLNSLLMLRTDFSFGIHLAEVLPTARPILEGFNLISHHGPIDLIAYEYLPADIYSSGVRLGSNSTFVVSNSWSFVLVFSAVLLLMKFRSVRGVPQVINTYLFIYSPFIIRRSIYSYLYDLMLLIAIFVLLSACKYLIQSNVKR